jgi:hypothetical protein
MKIIKIILPMIIIIALVILVKQYLSSSYETLHLTIEPATISADGSSIAIGKIVLADDDGNKSRWAEATLFLRVEDERIARVIGKERRETEDGELSVDIQSTLLHGATMLMVKDESGNTAEGEIQTTPVYSDSDGDGFPDVVELNSEEDRWRFREGFVRIAEAQLDSFSAVWNPEERDCAGLLRFAYREALKDHDAAWMEKIGFQRIIKLPTVEKYEYPDVPILGTRIFRTNEGEFYREDLQDTTFSAFAKGQYLKEYNAIFMGKTPRSLLSGDLLFFLHYDDPEMPFHAMIFLGDDNNVPEKNNDDWLIYHTGPVGDTNGKMKKLRLSTLNKHPDESWHAVKENPYFLGFYRWKILE